MHDKSPSDEESLEDLVPTLKVGYGPWILFFIALGFYGITRCRFPFPGESIRSLLQHWGQHPFVPMDYPVWGGIQRLIKHFAGAQALLGAHAFAVLVGALCVGLVYTLTASLTRGRSSEERVLAPDAVQRINRLSGLAAALFFAVSTPVWIASTRPFPLLWGTFLFLLWLYALKGTLVDRRVKWALALAFSTGLGLAEYVAFFTVTPFAAMVLAWVVWRSKSGHRLRRALLFSALFVLGFSPVLHTLFALRDGAMASSMEIEGLLSAGLFLARHKLFQLSTLLPQTGWLLVALQSLIPLLIILIPKRMLERRLIWGSYILHAVLSLILLMGFLNAPFSPWVLLKFKPFMILPALFTAIALGYLVGYWLGVCDGERKFDHWAVSGLRYGGRYLTLPLTLCFVGWAALQNYEEVNGNNGALVDAWVQQLCADASDSEWLISDGPTDELLLYYTQNDLASPLQMMSTQFGNTRWLMEYYGAQFDDPMMRSLGRLPLWPFVRAWFQNDPAIKDAVFFARTPGLRLPVVAQGLGYVPGEVAGTDPNASFKYPSPFYNKLKKLESRERLDGNPYLPMNAWVIRQASKSANNYGVDLEGAGRIAEAVVYYEEALSLDPENISALMNWGIWAERQGEKKKAEALKATLTGILNNFEKKKNIWQLAEYYGYVRHPMAFMDQGMAWAMSGDAKQARNELAKVLAIDPEHKQARQLWSNLLIREGAGDEAEAELVKRINRNPNDLAALRGLFQLRIIQEHFDKAEALLFRLRGLAGQQELLELDEAALHYSRGDLAAAEKILTEALSKNPEGGKIALALAQLMLEQNREGKAQALIAQALKSAGEMSPQEILAAAQMLKKIGKPEHSRLLMDRMVSTITHYQPALRFYLELQVEAGDRLAVNRVLNKLLTLNAEDPYGLFVMGLMHFGAGELAQAQAAWEKSVALDPAPGSLNSLAYVLHLRGHSLAALPLVQRALELDPNQAPAWDTLGVIYFAQQQHDQAVMALKKSLELEHRAPDVILHLAEVYDAMGKGAEAQALLESVRNQYGSLSAETRSRFDALRY